MTTGQIITIVVLVLLVAAIIGLYFYAKKQQEKQAKAEEQMKATAQSATILVIDKKRMKIKDAGFPAVVLDNVPKYIRWTKVCVVKAKVGPQIMTLIADEKIFDSIPVKKEVKATVSGIYITAVKGLHGKTAPVEQKKKSWWKRTVEAAQEKAGAKAVK